MPDGKAEVAEQLGGCIPTPVLPGSQHQIRIGQAGQGLVDLEPTMQVCAVVQPTVEDQAAPRLGIQERLPIPTIFRGYVKGELRQGDLPWRPGIAAVPRDLLQLRQDVIGQCRARRLRLKKQDTCNLAHGRFNIPESSLHLTALSAKAATDDLRPWNKRGE